MKPDPILPGVYRIPLGMVNAYLLDGDDLTLVDTGMPGDADRILEAIRSLGRQPGDLGRILVTHCHYDHAGSLARLKAATGAPAAMHPLDADLVRQGEAARPFQPAPNPLFKLLARFVVGSRAVEPAEIEVGLEDGQVLEAAGGLRVIHAPGHTAGQVVFLWPEHGGLLFAADTSSNFVGLGYPPIFEDLEAGQRTLAQLGELEFEAACFGHGRPILSSAARRFRRKWGKG